MRNDIHSNSPGTTHKPGSFILHPLGWMKARFRDIMVVAEVMHEVQWTAPWDEPGSPKARSRRWVS